MQSKIIYKVLSWHKASIMKLRSWSLVILTIITTASFGCAQAPGNTSDIKWLINVLEIKEGSVVADIGAGDGEQTLAVARHIGPEGHIYSTELGSNSIQNLKETIKKRSATNITVLKGHPKSTNLPEQCCDAIFMRRVYHHIQYPETMNSSLWQSLKPGGRLAIIDFEPRSSEAPPEERATGSQHGVTAKTVIEELEQAGFYLISSDKESGRNIYIVMEKRAVD
jgi:ubiquinone/menaquinone biosynthesis C-methylase UbiE